MKRSNNNEVDTALHMWFLQKCSSGYPISGPPSCEKALLFNRKLYGENTFQASSVWLENFKLRHGIREIGLYIEAEKYEEEFICNADKTVLFWRSLPRKTDNVKNPKL